MPEDVVFLFDCDNTLLDNDHVEVDLQTHLEREFGPQKPGSIGRRLGPLCRGSRNSRRRRIRFNHRTQFFPAGQSSRLAPPRSDGPHLPGRRQKVSEEESAMKGNPLFRIAPLGGLELSLS
jgi:FMN phosphatase YigB (HAD superfamily)